LALEALHKQVLPFLLRRLKDDVLNDLPPKIIQDYYCELSDLQKYLYDDFANSRGGVSATNMVKTDKSNASDAGQRHIFQSLQYLRKLCNHPALVLKDNKEAIDDALSHMPGRTKVPLDDIQHAPKLQALRFVHHHWHYMITECDVGNFFSIVALVQHRPLQKSRKARWPTLQMATNPFRSTEFSSFAR
jgi:SNF2 family DNA or RNA helicase